MLLGVLSGLLEVPEKVWSATVEKFVPQKLLEVNLRAFAAGRELVEEVVEVQK
jgi:indolepyruvate ferredoxin oxidoreductase beta subunit